MKLSAPWETYYKQIEALFGSDPKIKTEFDEETKFIKIYVVGDTKAKAISAIIPSEKKFGNVIVRINVIPANTLFTTQYQRFCNAFEGNPAFAYAKTTDGSHGEFAANYIVFKKEVVQFFNDDLSDINGNCTTLYEDIAREVFGEDCGVFFCTE